MDLFSFKYPDKPGFKDADTSRDAAISMVPTASLIREQCYGALTAPMTADEVALALDRTVLAVRPRFTELLRDGRIRDTGERRANASGRSAKVWCRT